MAIKDFFRYPCIGESVRLAGARGSAYYDAYAGMYIVIAIRHNTLRAFFTVLTLVDACSVSH